MVVIMVSGKRTHLLARVHAGETTLMTALATLAGNIFNLLLRTVGKVSAVHVGGHGDECVVDSLLTCVWVRWVGLNSNAEIRTDIEPSGPYI